MKAAELETPRVEQKAAGNAMSQIESRVNRFIRKLGDVDEKELEDSIYKRETGRPRPKGREPAKVMEDMKIFKRSGVGERETIDMYKKVLESKVSFGDNIAENIRKYTTINRPSGSYITYIMELDKGIGSLIRGNGFVKGNGAGSEYIGNKISYAVRESWTKNG